MDRQAHAAYARAVGVAEPDLLQRPLACFAAVYLLWPVVPQLFGDPELNLDLPHLLHGEQEFTFARPVEFGEQITPRGEVERLERRRGMTFISLATTGTDAGGKAVVQGRSLFVIREVAG